MYMEVSTLMMCSANTKMPKCKLGVQFHTVYCIHDTTLYYIIYTIYYTLHYAMNTLYYKRYTVYYIQCTIWEFLF